MRAVDADDVSRVLLNLRDRNIENKDMVFALEWAAQSVSRLPTLSPDVLRPVGKWKLGGFGSVSDATEKWYDKLLQGGFLYCSTCKCRANAKTNFCPNCGAKMKGE